MNDTMSAEDFQAMMERMRNENAAAENRRAERERQFQEDQRNNPFARRQANWRTARRGTRSMD